MYFFFFFKLKTKKNFEFEGQYRQLTECENFCLPGKQRDRLWSNSEWKYQQNKCSFFCFSMLNIQNVLGSTATAHFEICQKPKF